MTDAEEADGPVELVIEEPGWDAALPVLQEIADRAATAALAETGHDPGRWSLCVLACSDARIAALNAQFRGRETPTNVLSWPAFETLPVPAGPEREHLGDVAIALQTVCAEAQAAGIPLKDHALHLILHACLHLLGYDHERDEDADRMEGIERRVLAGLGLHDPYG